MIPVLFGVTFLAFFTVNYLPGNIVVALLGSNYNPTAAAALSTSLHLNQPILERYFIWAGHAIQGNLGASLANHEPVITALKSAAPPTVELVIVAQLMAIALAVLLAVTAVASRWTWVDRICTALALVGNSVPSFVFGLVLLVFFSVHWHLVSAIGWIPPAQGWGKNLGAISLPAFTLAMTIFPGYMRVFRQEMLDELENEEYVSLARMKGISTARVIFRHVARNSALGIVTLVGLSTGLLIGGAVIVEDIFSVPGIGLLLLNSINMRDATTVEGCILVIAVAIVVLNLAADVVYALLDPRVRDRS